MTDKPTPIFSNYFITTAFSDGTFLVEYQLGKDETIARVFMSQANAQALCDVIATTLEQHKQNQLKGFQNKPPLPN